MDYITKKISEKSDLGSFTNDYREAAIQEQSRLEYILNLILAYLWNKNIENTDEETRDTAYSDISHPSIGSILGLARKLDLDCEIFGGKKLKKFITELNRYPSIRNEKIGHGFSFGDDSEGLYKILSELYKSLYENGPYFIKNDSEIINVLSVDDTSAKGVLYKANGDCSPCAISKNSAILLKGCVYLRCGSSYFKVSPFIAIKDTDDFYIYSFIEDRLAYRATFNRLVKTGRAYFQVPELVNSGMEIDLSRVRSANGTIVNRYENNYKKYIDTSIVKKLLKFLKANKSTVFSTVWGHGGVGKTAAIQRVCEALLNEDRKTFDYITFISAKDRRFNYHKGQIESVSGGVDSYESAIRYINNIVFCKDSSDPEEITNFDGKVLIILDDYETFNQEEKDKLINFIKTLNIDHHKVVITTRSASHITGEEIEVEELTPEESLEFFDSVLKNELSLDNVSYKRGKGLKELQDGIHGQTNGRPLFIFQSAIIYGESGSISTMLDADVSTANEAIDFLYGRIFDYLSPAAKQLFGAMGLLTVPSDLSNLITKLQYILNMEKKEDEFYGAIGELVKLKIITVIDDKYFKVYSNDIALLMDQSFEDPSGNITERLGIVGSDKKLDNDYSLLIDADNSRISRKPTEVIQKYRHLISRLATPEDIKIKAIVNLAQYLVEDTGSLDEGLSVFNEFNPKYCNNIEFLKAYSVYLWRGADGEKQESINIVKNIVDNSSIGEDQRLDYLCVLMRYETTFLIDSREELKDSYRLGDVDEYEYDESFAEQRDYFFRIYRFPGLEICKTIKNDTLKYFDHELKVKVLNGLSYYIEVCIRRRRFSEIDGILSYIFNELIYNYHEVFKRKLGRINNAKPDSRKKYEDYITQGSLGDRRTQLEITRDAGKSSTKKRNRQKKSAKDTTVNVGSFGLLLSEAIDKK